jgi:SAM-dependent methyltransferase
LRRSLRSWERGSLPWRIPETLEFPEEESTLLQLTEQRYWDDYWSRVSLPMEARRDRHHLYLNEILNVFDRFLPYNDELTALEIGGSPGRYLAYLHRTFGYKIHCLDYSERGCEATRENFRILGIPGVVHQADLFSDELNLPRFDVVYSLGLIEHFTDQASVVERHLRVLKPGGLLVLGVPNFQGISKWFLSRLAPTLLAQHQLPAMDLRNWEEFERAFELDVLFKDYVGGFEPSIFRRREEVSRRTAAPYFVARVLTRLLHSHFRPLRRLNGRLVSGYAMGVYRQRTAGEIGGAR